jgi:catechol 2,3-dioxygenase-like lactoylglutathione lyase family enzyme
MDARSALGRLGLPRVAQIGYVVRNLDAAIALYDPLFGPFRRMDGSVQAAEYRGRLADCRLELAFGWSGELEIELIAWISGDCPHREFLEKGREGMHHLQFRVDDCDGWIARLRPLGYQPIWYKHRSADTKFAYLERPDDPTLIEFLQMPPTGPGSQP